MKQHIIAEQLNELSEQSKEKLKAWWKPQYGDWVLFEKEEWLLADCPSIRVDWNPKDKWSRQMAMYTIMGMNDEYGDYYDIKKTKTILPLLSVEQMIEFLGDDWIDEIRFVMGGEEDLIKLEDSYDDIYFPRASYLCDALWAVVRERLEKK